MNQHLSFRSGNPSLNKNTFASFTDSIEEKMTIDGTVNKTGILLLILIVCATFTMNQPNPVFIFGGFIGGFILSLVTIFKKEWSPITVPIYSALKGLALGGISSYFEKMYPGIVSQAIFLLLECLEHYF